MLCFPSLPFPASGSGTVTPAAEPAAAAPAKPQNKGRKDWKTTRAVKTHTITADDIANGHDYTIFDVVMPIPGFDVDLPGGKLRDMYVKILNTDGLDVEGSWKKQKCVPFLSFSSPCRRPGEPQLRRMT